MKDWLEKLDDFLKLSERNILKHTGSISHEVAVTKAEAEYEKFHKKQIEEPDAVEKHFEEAVKKIKKLKELKTEKKRTKK
jgi:hypothetical protein